MEPAHVLITGAAGQIGYIISHWIAGGALFDERPVVLHLFDIPVAQKRLEALVMELEDCAFKTLAGIVATTEPEPAFRDIDCAFLVASVPLKPGQVRADMLGANAPIFKNTGEWLSQYAKPTCKVCVIGNPNNTNCLVAMLNCKNIPKENFTSLSMLDHNRAVYSIAQKVGCDVSDLHGIMVWGNHGESMAADLTHATFTKEGKEIPVLDVLDKEFAEKEFFQFISQRAWAILEHRGFTSAASPVKASIQHMRALLFGTKPGEILSIGIPVPDDEPYGIKKGVIFSFPVTVDADGKYHVVKDLPINPWLREKLDITEKDLISERESALRALGQI